MEREKGLHPFRAQTESFTGLLDGKCYYVDKTGYIRYLIEKGDKICVVTRPRRFGKTLMHMMLKTFFEYRLDKDGKPVDNSRYFEGLAVSKAGPEVMSHLGQYPVIYVTLKDVRGDTFEDYEAGLANAVKWACRDQRGLLNSSKLSANDRAFFDKFLDLLAIQTNVWDALQSLSAWPPCLQPVEPVECRARTRQRLWRGCHTIVLGQDERKQHHRRNYGKSAAESRNAVTDSVWRGNLGFALREYLLS